MVQQPKQKTKVRFTSLDICAMVTQLKSKLLGCRITNIYDLSPSTYLFKMSRGDDKHYLVCQNGMRFHTTQTKAQKNKMPSGFTMKFRKYLRSKRLEAIRQVGMERVVVMTFGAEAFSNHLILELYSQGNIILTDQNYRIIQCMRSHQFTEKVRTAVGELYPFEYAANIYLEKIEVQEGRVREVLKEAENPVKEEEVKEEVKENKKAGKGKKAEKKQAGMKIKDMVFKLIPCLFPQVIDHILTKGGFQPNQKCSEQNIETICKASAFALEWTKSFQKQIHKGYLLISQQKPKQPKPTIPKQQGQAPPPQKQQPKQKYTDYAPYLHVSFESKPHKVLDSFSKAVDLYYQNFKKPQQGEDLQQLAWKKYEQIKKDQQSRVDKLRTQQQDSQHKAQLIQQNIQDVDAVIKIFKTMLDSGYSWSQITKMLYQSKKSGDPLANMIHQINLQNGTVQILLGDPQQPLCDLTAVQVQVQFNAYTNATQYYESRKKNYQKEVRTKEASNQVLKVAEREALKDLEKRRNQRQGNVVSMRKPYWFEKFYWFVTSQSYLVISGRDSHQNQIIVKKYMRAGDLYMHSDYGGAASTVIKNPTKQPVPRISLQEAAIFTVCRSKAWDTKIISGAWWVYNDQVSKSAPTGQFLPTGSFMIRGKKNFVYPNKMEMGITLLYKIGVESLQRHVKEPEAQAQLSEIGKLDKQKSEIEEAHEEKMNAEEYSIVNLESAKPKQQQQQKQGKKGETKQQQQQQQQNAKQTAKPQTKKDQSDDGSSDNQSQEQQIEQTKNAPPSKSKKQPSKKQPQQPQQPKHQNRNKKKLQKLKKYMQEQDEDEREIIMKMLGAKEMKHMRDESDEEEEVKGKNKKDRKSKKEKFSMVRKEEEEVIDKEKVLFLQEEVKTENKFIKKGKEETRKSEKAKSQKVQPQQQKTEEKVKQATIEFKPEPVVQVKQPKTIKQQKPTITQSTEKTEATQQVKQTKQPTTTTQPKQQNPKLQAQQSSSSGTDGQQKQPQKKDQQTYQDDDKLLDSDINQLHRLVGKIYPQDTYQCLITMCAPYPTITQNRFKIKLTPGGLKKGKAARNILHYFTTLDLSEQEKQILKTYPEQEVINALVGNVKLGAAGMLKLEMKEKAEKKEKRREKDGKQKK